MRATLLALSVVLCLPAAARGDWQYTKWGMTPEEVARASGGAVKAEPPAQRRTIADANLRSGADGTFQDGPIRLRVQFSFDATKGGLACVFYGVMNQADNDAFKAALVKRFGPPQRTTGLQAIGMAVLSWEPGDDSVEFQAMEGEASFAMHCKK